MKIRVNPHNVEIIREQTEPINEKEIKVSKCVFEFDDKITNDFVKEAYFTLNGETYKQIIQNNECEYPSEVLTQKGTLEIGVVAYKVENEQEIVRYNPSPDYFESWVGSLKDAENTEPITPSEMEQFEQELQEGLNQIGDKIDEVDDKITEVNTAITETNNLNLDVSDKVDGDVTVTLTKKDASTKSVVISDGTSLQFKWQGTSLGIKTDDMQDYVFVDLQGQIGPMGPQGNPFQVKKTYATIDLMIADYDNMEINDYVMISGNIEQEDNAKLFVKTEQEDPVYRWQYLADFSGASGIQGPQGETGPQGPRGQQGPRGEVGPTGNGISSIEKTGTSGLVDTYTITYTNGNTTTFDVSNGNGIDRIEKTATVGNKDTYTIYFTNGTTTTYEVSNGEVTREELEEEVERLSMIYNAFPSTTGEAEEPSINGTAEVPFKEIGLKGNTSQDGEPTPDTPIPVNVVTGDNEVKVEGKNLAFTGWAEDFVSRINDSTKAKLETYDNKNCLYFGASAGYQEYSTKYLFKTNWKENTQYTFKFKLYTPGTDTNISIQYTDGTSSYFGTHTANIWTDITYSSTSGKTIEYLRASYNDRWSRIDLDTFMVYEGTDNADYVPYQSQTYPINLGSMELCKIGDYQDVIKRSSGKNLFDKDRFEIFPTLSISEIQFVGKPNTTYTMSSNLPTSSGNANLFFCLPNDSFGTQTNGITPTQSRTITTGADGLAKIGYRNYQNSVSGDLKNDFWYMLNEGTTALPYEPYGKVWCKYGAIGKVVLDGSENWQLYPTTYENYLTAYNGNKRWGQAGNFNADFLSDYFQPNDANLAVQKNFLASSGYASYVKISDTIVSTIEELKTWLSTHNTTVYYQLATPTVTPITDTTLIEQLDNLEKAYSYDTQTNISQTNQDKPFIISYEAILSLRNVLEI